MYTWFHHEIHDCHSGFDGRNTENIKLSLSEILRLIWYLSVAVTDDKYCIFGRVQRPYKINYYCGKFAAVSCGIWQTGPQNLEKFAAENCGPYKSLKICCCKTAIPICTAFGTRQSREYWRTIESRNFLQLYSNGKCIWPLNNYCILDTIYTWWLTKTMPIDSVVTCIKYAEM